MNRALLYLWLTLLKRRVLGSIANLRRPTSLIGFVALMSFLAFLFHYRHAEVFAQLTRPPSLFGGALLMLCGSLYMGFRQRGLVFEPPDLEFLFTAPFTRRQIIIYRLLPNYLYTVAQSLVFLAIFSSHLKHPFLVAACLTLLQIACFHISSAAAIYAGNIRDDSHYRLRWMMLGVFAFITVFYFRWGWDFHVVPALANSAPAKLLFYPAVSVPDLALPSLASLWAFDLGKPFAFFTRDFWHAALWLGLFTAVAAATLWALLKLKGDIFEASLANTSHAAEKRARLQQGQSLASSQPYSTRSFPLPSLPVFRGFGAIIWKNLVVAARCRRELTVAAVFTLIYTGFLVGLRWALHHAMDGGGDLPPSEVRAFDESLVSLLFFLPFFLQRSFPFDFRRDGQHLVGFRTLPANPLALTLAELAVPTGLCLLFQAIGMAILLAFARFEWYLVLLLLLVYPLVVLAINSVWNLHYLLAATRRAGGRPESASPVGTIMVVALSFLVLFPAVWTAQFVGRRVPGHLDVPIGFGVALAVQCVVDFSLLLLLARIFRRFEVSREFQ